MENNKRKLKLPIDAKLPYLAAGCAGLMLFFEFFAIAVLDGTFRTGFFAPWQQVEKYATLYNGRLFFNLAILIGAVVPVVLLVLCLGLLKRNPALLLLPTGLYVLSKLIFTFCVISNYLFRTGISKGDIILLFIGLAVFVLVVLTVCNVIKSGFVLGFACSAVCVYFIIATVFGQTPFAKSYTGTTVLLWDLFQNLGFYSALAVLGFSLSSNPEKRYYEKTTPTFYPQPMPSAPPVYVPANTPPIPKGAEARLTELQELKNKGLISDQELEEKRKEILSQL